MHPYSKYHVAPLENRTIDNIVFASKMEMKRYLQLKLLVKAGEIKELILQHKFTVFPAFEKNGKHYQEIIYIADFSYYDNKTKKRVAEDVKGVATDVFKIKQKLFHYHNNMELRIITADML